MEGRKSGGEVKGYQSAVRKYCRPAELWVLLLGGDGRCVCCVVCWQGRGGSAQDQAVGDRTRAERGRVVGAGEGLKDAE